MAFTGDEGARYIGAFLITFGAAWALTPLAGRFAHRHGFLDQPGGHSTHSAATPTLGGLAVALAFVAVGVWAGGADGQLVTVLAGATMLAVVGAFDDRRSVSPWLRLGLESAAAVALWVVGVRAGLLGHTWFDLPLTVLWVMAVVNAFNMIDNHDGIAALVAAMSTLGIAAISIRAATTSSPRSRSPSRARASGSSCTTSRPRRSSSATPARCSWASSWPRWR